MKEMQFSITIYSSKERVWDILWQDDTFRKWAGLIDPGTYMQGVLEVGNEVQFISSINGYGVTSLVEELVLGESLVLRHHADTQENGSKEREKEWTGGKESYSLHEQDGMTTLTVSFDVPEDLEEYFSTTYPKALEKVREMAEK